MFKGWALRVTTLICFTAPLWYFTFMVTLGPTAWTLERAQQRELIGWLLFGQAALYLATILAYSVRKQWRMVAVLLIALPLEVVGVVFAGFAGCGAWGGYCL